jgi:hypothetical protein
MIARSPSHSGRGLLPAGALRDGVAGAAANNAAPKPFHAQHHSLELANA